MQLEEQSLLVLRLVGLSIGTLVVIGTFRKFRMRRIGRTETLLRWCIGFSLVVVCVYPGSVNWLISLFSMDSYAFGRMLTLLVLSNLLIWILILRERGKLSSNIRNFDRLVRSTALKEHFSNAVKPRLQGTQVLVAIPALNEAANLPSVLSRIPQTILGYRTGVLVIDDGSDDNTPDVVRAAGHAVVSHPIPRGQGAALRLAYDAARQLNATAVVTLDADGQHRPDEIDRLVLPILDGSRDFVIGSRVLGTRENDSRFRLAGIYLNSLLINLLAGTRISDCSSGFKAIRVESLAKIDLTEEQFQAAETIISAAHNGLRIAEVPITVQARLSGHSKKGRDFTYGINFTRSVFKSWWR